MLWHAGVFLCGIGSVLRSVYPGIGENRQGKKSAEPQAWFQHHGHLIAGQRAYI
jgi:hypothetical protein